ncbi:unnamed protein product [Mytilus edulis]|uniref:ZAD domain-containing protein n=1 Tax=Mytilus edulis TaxID=6550 RepID=A0A8S3SKZ4_MYTED|nr:unnamed protein product [Mytilus edulis]
MDTPIKTISNTSKCCLLCGDTEKRLHCLTKHKASNEGYTRSIETTLDIKLDSSLLEFMFICEKCANACKHFNNFRGRAKQNLDNFISNHTTSRTKRMPKTPPSAMKISTADQIENSVEKLRNLNLDEKEKGARVANQICKLGKSVLFKSSAKDLSERNWFIDIGKEMLQHCPEFLSLLLSAIVYSLDLEHLFAWNRQFLGKEPVVEVVPSAVKQEAAEDSQEKVEPVNAPGQEEVVAAPSPQAEEMHERHHPTKWPRKPHGTHMFFEGVKEHC